MRISVRVVTLNSFHYNSICSLKGIVYFIYFYWTVHLIQFLRSLFLQKTKQNKKSVWHKHKNKTKQKHRSDTNTKTKQNKTKQNKNIGLTQTQKQNRTKRNKTKTSVWHKHKNKTEQKHRCDTNTNAKTKQNTKTKQKNPSNTLSVRETNWVDVELWTIWAKEKKKNRLLLIEFAASFNIHFFPH